MFDLAGVQLVVNKISDPLGRLGTLTCGPHDRQLTSWRHSILRIDRHDQVRICRDIHVSADLVTAEDGEANAGHAGCIAIVAYVPTGPFGS